MEPEPEGREGMTALRRRVQMIFQDPYQTLNPRQRVEAIVTEPLQVQGVPEAEHDARVRRARSRTSIWSPTASLAATRTSSRAGSASAWRSRRRWCWSPTD